MAEPEITFRHGQCQASVVEHECHVADKVITLKSVTFERRYIDKDGKMQTTNSLRVNDIPKAILVLNRCYEFLTVASQEEGGWEG